MSDVTIDSFSQPHRAVLARFEIQRVALVALFAVGLGFAMQSLILATRLLAGGPPAQLSFVADVAQGVTWSAFVCTGVAVGVVVGRTRKLLAGLFGLIFAPLGIALAKASQKAMLAVTNALDKPDMLPLVMLGSVRAIEYGLLAWLLAALAEKEVARPTAYVGIGATIGILFGGLLVLLTLSIGSPNPTTAQLAGMIVNEVGSPIGCALLIFLGQLVARNVVIYKRHAATTPAYLTQ